MSIDLQRIHIRSARDRHALVWRLHDCAAPVLLLNPLLLCLLVASSQAQLQDRLAQQLPNKVILAAIQTERAQCNIESCALFQPEQRRLLQQLLAHGSDLPRGRIWHRRVFTVRVSPNSTKAAERDTS